MLKNLSIKIICIITIILSTYFLIKGVEKFLYPIKYNKIVESVSKNYNIDKHLIYAIIKVESGFNEKALSSKGAVGLMQITPKTAEYIGELKGEEKFDLTNPKTNIDFGTYYLKYLIDKFKVLDTAIIAYNAGEGNVSEWLKNEEYSSNGKTLKKIPYKESKEYLEKVKRVEVKYKNLYD